MTVFITGGSGFVGLNLIEQLLARGDRVVSFSLTPPPERAMASFQDLPGTLQHVDGDVCDAKAIDDALARSTARRVIHAAVITAGTERERREPAAIVATNIQGTVNALDAARRRGAERFVYLSSASVYGANAESADALCEEHTAPLPQSLYAVTKYAAEGIARRYGTVFDMQVFAARLSAVFGRWEHDTGLRDTLSPPFLLAAMAQSGDAAVLADDGYRDWIYGPDAAAGILALLDAAALGHDIYNVGTGCVWSLRQWCEKLAARYPAFTYRLGTDSDPGCFIDPGRRSPLSVERITRDTTYTPRFGLEESFDDYLGWLQGSQAGTPGLSA
jgi:nucleoside-diphosphate-sugar epimerase